MLMGTFNHSLDEKNRLIIPAAFRKSLGQEFVMTKNPDHCLALYSHDEWKRLTEKLDSLPKISSEPARRLRRFYFGNSIALETDKQGRILVPEDLRTYAGLSKDLTLVGVDDHVEIWDAKAWEDYNGSIDISDITYDLNGINL